MSTVVRREGVDDDIFEIALYLAADSREVASRFVERVESTLAVLATTSLFGGRKEFAAPRLAEVRTWRVDDFPNHLIYYLPIPDGIDVLAIIHAARSPFSILGNR